MQPNTPYNEKPIAASNVVNKYYNKKAYTNPALRSTYSKSGHWFNIRLIRYSDVLLMAAEAANELGNSAQALVYLEQVRARARAGNNAILPAVTTTVQSELRDAIRHERRVEARYGIRSFLRFSALEYRCGNPAQRGQNRLSNQTPPLALASSANRPFQRSTCSKS